jgi:BASS family bile acid:Na+ symporter
VTIAQLIPLAINASMFLIVFALGLEATMQDVTYLFRRPSLLFRSILSMNVIMLAVAVALAMLFDPPPAIRIAIVALAVSPVPPVLPSKQEKAGGSEAYTLGLLTAAALVAIVLVPASIELIGRSFGIDMHQPASTIASIVLVSVIVPLAAGILVNRFAPGFAAKIARPISIFATVLLIVAFLPVLIFEWPSVWSLVGNGIVLVLAAFTLIGLAVGHLLGGPDPGDRTVLALATSARHPGVAIAIASLNFPDHQKAVAAVVMFHLILAAIVAIPYVKWRTATTRAEAR